MNRTFSSSASVSASSFTQSQHMSEHIRGYKWHRSLGLQMRFTMVAYRELQKFGGRLSTLLFPDSLLESTLWMKAARLRSEWPNTSFIFSVSDLWMSVWTSRARFVSSHDHERDAGLQMSLRSSSRILRLKTSLNRSYFIWNDTGFLWFPIELLPCLLSPRHASMAAVRAHGWSGGVWMRGGPEPSPLSGDDGGGSRRTSEEHFDRKPGQQAPLFPLGGDFTLQCSHHYDYSRCSGQPVGHCLGLQKQKAQEGR